MVLTMYGGLVFGPLIGGQIVSTGTLSAAHTFFIATANDGMRGDHAASVRLFSVAKRSCAAGYASNANSRK